MLPIAISSCGDAGDVKDAQFCKCLEVTSELNDYSGGLFTKNLTEEDAVKMQSLRKIKEKECKDYVAMSGKEMLKRKALCK